MLLDSKTKCLFLIYNVREVLRQPRGMVTRTDFFYLPINTQVISVFQDGIQGFSHTGILPFKTFVSVYRHQNELSPSSDFNVILKQTLHMLRPAKLY